MKENILITKLENNSSFYEFERAYEALSFEFYDFRLKKLANKIKYQKVSKIKLKFVES